MNSKVELKVCPFCGGAVRLPEGAMGLSNMFICDNDDCGAVVSFKESKDKEKSINAWNRRVNDDA